MLSIRSQSVRFVRPALIALAAAVAAGRVAAAEDAGGLTLAGAVTRALCEGREARIARLEAGQADDALGQAHSAYWPQAEIKSQAGWSNRQNDTLDAINGQGVLKRYPLSTLGSDEAWLSVYIEQMIFDLSRWRGIQRSELEAEVAAVSEAQQREQISYSVLERYLTVLRLEELATLDARQLSDAEALDRQAALLLESGRALAAEREQVALTLAETRLRLNGRRVELEEARGALADAIGDVDGSTTALRLVPDSLPVPAPPSADLTTDDALGTAPELRILDLRRRMEDVTLTAARAERLPTLGLRGGYFHYGTKRFDSFEDELAVGVDLKIPVFNGFKTSRAIDGAGKAVEAARLRYDAMLDAKRIRVRELSRRLAALQEQPALAARRADMAWERQRLADLSLQAQRGTVAQALAARADALRDAGAAIDGRVDRLLLWATLQRETGRLAAQLTGEASAQP